MASTASATTYRASPRPPSSGSSPLKALARPLLWSLGTLLAAGLAAPIDWRAALLCLLAPMGWRSPLWLAVCAAPLWCAAVLSGHWLALPLLIASIGALARPGLGRVVLVVGLLEAARAWLLQPLVPAATTAAPLLLGGIVAGGLAQSVPRGKLPAAALLLAGIGLGGGALWSLRDPLDTRAAVTASARWDTLRLREPEAVGFPRWALREAPRWHALADRLPVAEALGVGWQPARAPLSPERRIEAAHWLEANERGGEALRLLRRGDDPQSRWWLVYFRRAAGQSVAFRDEGWRPQGAGALPTGPVEFPTNRTDTLVLSVEERVPAVEVVASAEWFEGPPTLVVELDGAAFPLRPGRSPRRFVLPVPLEAGPHRLRLRYETDRFSPGEGDRNVYVHEIRAVSR